MVGTHVQYPNPAASGQQLRRRFWIQQAKLTDQFVLLWQFHERVQCKGGLLVCMHRARLGDQACQP